MTKAQERQQDRADAIKSLRENFGIVPGARVGTILRHVSRSGMSRTITVVVQGQESVQDISWLVARAIGAKMDKHERGVVMEGCGMDMGHEIVYRLSYAMHPEGFGCIGERCPSNEHANGDRDRTPHAKGVALACGPEGDGHKHWHTSRGYSLRHYWV